MGKDMLTFIVQKIREHRFRRSIRSLVSKGMKIGRGVHIMHGVSFDQDYAALISIGDNCTITSGVVILAHDASTFRDLGFAKVGKVEIKDNCFIGVNAIILPGVSIGPNAIIGAGSVVNQDIPEDCLASGNPARPVARKSEYLQKHKDAYKVSETANFNDFNQKGLSAFKNRNFKKTYLSGGEEHPNLKWLDEERTC